MDTVNWDAFLKGWQGQTPTSPTPSSESKLLTSSDKYMSLSELCGVPLITTGVGAANTSILNFLMLPFTKMGKILANFIALPKTFKDKHPDE